MNKLIKILLPFFPNNDCLQKHWWHRLAVVIAILVMVSLVFVVLNDLVSYYYSSYYLQPLSRGEIIFAFLLAYVVSNTILAVIYRAILYIATGDKWKKKG